MMLYVLVAVAVAVILFGLWSYFRGGWKVVHQRLIGATVFLYGLYLASLTGSVTSFVLPGIGSVAVGAGTGAAVGALTYLVIGTVGVATGGVGIAVGLGAMTGMGALLGSAGAASGGIGFTTQTYPLVSPIFWVPLLIIGVYFLLGRRKVKQDTLLALSAPTTEGDSAPESST